MRKLTLTMLLVGALAVVPLDAAADYHPNPKASDCGQYHGVFGSTNNEVNPSTIPGGAGSGPGGIGDTNGPANSLKGCQRNL